MYCHSKRKNLKKKKRKKKRGGPVNQALKFEILDIKISVILIDTTLFIRSALITLIQCFRNTNSLKKFIVLST